jgi:hypothetical protein
VTYVFVGGLHRSGTSLVHRLLRAHPDVSGFEGTGAWEDEGQHLQDVLPTARALGGPGRFGFADGAHLTEASPAVSDATRDALLAAWRPHWDLDRPVLLEKSPPNLIRFRFLRALFPDARLVAVVRHPIAVAEATRRMRWVRRLRSTRSVVEHWAWCMDRFERDRARLGPVHLVRYEEFVADPEARFAELLRFLDLDPAPLGETIHTDANARWEAHWRRTRRLRPGKVKAVEALEHRVRRHGFSIRGFGRS